MNIFKHFLQTNNFEAPLGKWTLNIQTRQRQCFHADINILAKTAYFTLLQLIGCTEGGGTLSLRVFAMDTKIIEDLVF